MGPFHLRSIYVRLERQEEFPRIRHHLLHALPAAILHAALLVHLERQKKAVFFGLDGMLRVKMSQMSQNCMSRYV